ncbi:DUF2189 domain-containing protein [Roseobacter sp. A03A-229]
MVRTIGNPLSWMAQAFGGGAQGVSSGVQELGGADDGQVELREIDVSHLKEALSEGKADFLALRTDVFSIVFIYPVIGLFMVWFALNNQNLYLIFPLISGFALLGPVAAIGLYEMSRRRELGVKTSWWDGFCVIGSPSILPILVLSGLLATIFLVWIIFAHFVYALTLGPEAPASASIFLQEALTTVPGWLMITIGSAIGFVFAAVVLAISCVSFPMLIDRRVGLPVAVVTSLNVAKRNPRTVAAWGAIVVGLLGFGVLTLFIGLIFVLPILGHATWHLYRKAVVPRSHSASER